MKEKIIQNKKRFNIEDMADLLVLDNMLELPSGMKLMKLALENPVFQCYPYSAESYRCELELVLNDKILFSVGGNEYINMKVFHADQHIPADKLREMGFFLKKFPVGLGIYIDTYEKYIGINTFNKDLLDFMNEYEKSEFMHSHAKTEIELIKEYLEEEED